ncbi:CSC1-like protein erd4, partial [Cymbomonas tetramitiformis]
KSVAEGSASREIVQRFMAGTYPFDLGIEAMMVPPTEHLETLVKNHQALKDQIEDAIALEEEAKEAQHLEEQDCNSTLNPMIAATETLGFGPKTIEALQEELEVASAALEKCYSSLEDERSSTAMVYIPSLYYAALAPQVLHTQDCETWNVERAPLPTDIIWSNLHLRWWERLIREIAIFIINFLITVFFLIPVTFVSSLATMDNIEDAIPALESLEDYPSLVAFLDGYLPGAPQPSPRYPSPSRSLLPFPVLRLAPPATPSFSPSTSCD